jgi:DNA-binding transcriptional regulator YiaG
MKANRKYKSEAFQAIHEDAVANFEVGAMSEKEMREFDRAYLMDETPEPPRPECAPSVRPLKIYAMRK